MRFAASEMMSLTEESARYDLAESVGVDLRLRDLLDPQGEDGLLDLALSYGTAQGDAKLRAAIAAQNDCLAEHVIVTIGGMHALFLMSMIDTDARAQAVTTAPLFPLARRALHILGAQVQILPVSFDARYALDVERLVSLLTPHTRLVCLASPQNPSGVSYQHAALVQVLESMQRICPQAHLIVDETYRHASYGDRAIAPSAIALSTQVVAIASLSKCHGAPGLRIGWAATHDASLRAQLIHGKFATVISASRIDEALATRVLERSDTLMPARRAHLEKCLHLTSQWVSEHDELIEWVRPDAGALCCVRLRAQVFDADAVERFYAGSKHHEVRVARGNWFGDEARVFRLGFGLLSPTELERGLHALSRALHGARG